jgi:KUP system potassium uptake protein
MEAAYGLAITITMLMTTILLSQYIKFNKSKPILSKVILIVFGTIEISFLYANLFKFIHGGYVTIIISSILAFLMYIWIQGTNIKQRYTQWVKLANYKDQFKALKEDMTVPLFCTNLVYLSEAQIGGDIENKIIYSIFNKQPKRAKYYWFVNVKVTDEPYTKEYSLETLVPNEAYVINFKLGFRIDQRVNEFLSQIIQDLVQNKEIRITPRKYWMNYENRVTVGDFKFVMLEEILPNHTNLSKWDNFIISIKLLIKQFTISQAKWYGIDTSTVSVEKVPVIIGSYSNEKLKRIN